MRKKITIFTGSRSEFGLLKNLIIELRKSNKFKVSLVVSGSHVSEKHGYTINEILKEKIKINKKIRINLNDKDEKKILLNLSDTIKKFSSYFRKKKIDLLIILGDRWETFAACIACNFMKIPIAHIHGGESTLSAIDDSIRHSITKMSYLHFVSTNRYRNRIISMGENPKRVINVGAMCGEAIKKFVPFEKKILEKKINFVFRGEKVFLISFHPETLIGLSPLKQIYELINALKKIENVNFIFTSANVDAGSSKINGIISNECKKNKNFFYYKSLGQKLYWSVMYYSDGLIGNSSSGILEAPYFNKIFLNIGDRQKGRLQNKNVINVELSEKKILKKMRKILNSRKKLSLKKNIYGNGKPSKTIVRYLSKKKIPSYPIKTFFEKK